MLEKVQVPPAPLQRVMDPAGRSAIWIPKFMASLEANLDDKNLLIGFHLKVNLL